MFSFIRRFLDRIWGLEERRLQEEVRRLREAFVALEGEKMELLKEVVAIRLELLKARADRTAAVASEATIRSLAEQRGVIMPALDRS